MTATLLVETPVVVPTSVLDDALRPEPVPQVEGQSLPEFDRSREYFGAFLPPKPDAPLPFTRPPIDAPTLTEAVRAICQSTH